MLRADPRGTWLGLAALTLSCLGDLITGLTLGSITGTLKALPGLIVLVPAAIGARGNVFGALGSRLGTLVHQGRFHLSRRLDSPVGQNVAAAVVLSLSTSLVLAKVMCSAFGLRSISIPDLVVISVIGAVLSSALVLLVTLVVAAYSVVHRVDLDNVAAPIVTTTGDVVTLPCLFAATILVRNHWITAGISALCGVAAVASLAFALRRDAFAIGRRIVVESLPVW